MGTNNLIFLENIEWFDESGQELVHRIPEEGSGEIKYGAQLTVRESQAGIFFYRGKAVGAFGPGRHTLKTGNIPILTKIASLPWGMSSPLRAEVYLVNLKVFTNLKWGTRDPVAFKDSELGLVRLRAFGVFNLQVVQPVLVDQHHGRHQRDAHNGRNRRVSQPGHRVAFQRLDGREPRLDLEPALPLRCPLRRAYQAAGLGFQPFRYWADPSVHQRHHAARRGAAGDRRPQPHGGLSGHEQTDADEGGHGDGKGRAVRRDIRSRCWNGSRSRADAAGHVCPVLRRWTRPTDCRFRSWRLHLSGMPASGSCRRQVLPAVRPPTGRLRSVPGVQQEPDTGDKILPAVRPCGRG